MRKLLILVLLVSTKVNAYVDCPSSKVKYIQPDKTLVYIMLEGQDWQKLGDYEEPSMDAKLSIALAAFASGKRVKIRFPNGHNPQCSSFNNSTSAQMIRITHE